MIMAVALLGRLCSTTRVMTCMVGRAMKGLLDGGQLFHFRCTGTGAMERTQQKHKTTPHDHGVLVQQCRLVQMGCTGSLLPQDSLERRVMMASRQRPISRFPRTLHYHEAMGTGGSWVRGWLSLRRLARMHLLEGRCSESVLHGKVRDLCLASGCRHPAWLCHSMLWIWSSG